MRLHLFVAETVWLEVGLFLNDGHRELGHVLCGEKYGLGFESGRYEGTGSPAEEWKECCYVAARALTQTMHRKWFYKFDDEWWVVYLDSGNSPGVLETAWICAIRESMSDEAWRGFHALPFCVGV